MSRPTPHSRWPAVAICTLCSAWATQADAQDFNEAFQLETLEFGSSSTSIYGVDTSAVTGHAVPTANLWFQRVNRPYIRGDQAIVDDRWMMVFGGGFGLTDRLQLDVHLPLIVSQNGAGLVAGETLPSSATGDIRLRAKWLAWTNGRFGLGATATMWTESGSLRGLASNRVVRGEPAVVADAAFGDVLVSANLGYQFRRTREVAGYRYGDAFRWGTAARAPLAAGFGVEGSIFGEWIPGGAPENASPVEALGGVFWQRAGARVSLGAGTGLHRNVGAPRYRLTLGLSYTLPDRAPGRSIGPGDWDADGRYGEADQCPHHAETYDGFEDYDGCPDPDDDEDGVADVADACPGASGVAEKSGCPVFDVDDDGIDDAADGCPRDPEDFDGDRDDDGCPEEPRVAAGECPEGVDCDERDEPLPRREVVDERLYFGTDSTDFEPEKSPLLGDLVTLLEEDPTIETIIVEGHTDSRGSEEHNRQLSLARARAVRDVLVQRGISPDRIDARGAGESQPQATNETVEGRAENRRVQFTIIRPERPRPVADDPRKLRFGIHRFESDPRTRLTEAPPRFLDGARLNPPADHRCRVDDGPVQAPLVLTTGDVEAPVGTTVQGRQATRTITCILPDGSESSFPVEVELPGFALVGGIVRGDHLQIPQGRHAIVEIQFNERSIPLDVDAPELSTSIVRVTSRRSRLLLLDEGSTDGDQLRIGVDNRTILRVPVEVQRTEPLTFAGENRRQLELGVGSAITGPIRLDGYARRGDGAMISSVRYTARLHANEWFSAGLVGDVGPLIGANPVQFMPGIGFEGVVHAPLERFRPFASAGFEAWFPGIERSVPALEGAVGADWEPEPGAGIRGAVRVVVLTDAGEPQVLPGGFLGVFTSFR